MNYVMRNSQWDSVRDWRLGVGLMGNVGQLKKALQDIDDSVIVMLYSYSGEDQEWRGYVCEYHGWDWDYDHVVVLK